MKTAAELLEETEKLADATPWMPHKEEGQPRQIAGTVAQISFYESDMGQGQIPCFAIIEDETGDVWSVMAFHTVLRDRVQALDPRVGDGIAIIYKGKAEESKPGQQPPHIYAVGVDHRDATTEPTLHALTPTPTENGDSVADTANVVPDDDIPFVYSVAR